MGGRSGLATVTGVAAVVTTPKRSVTCTPSVCEPSTAVRLSQVNAYGPAPDATADPTATPSTSSLAEVVASAAAAQNVTTPAAMSATDTAGTAGTRLAARAGVTRTLSNVAEASLALSWAVTASPTNTVCPKAIVADPCLVQVTPSWDR